MFSIHIYVHMYIGTKVQKNRLSSNGINSFYLTGGVLFDLSTQPFIFTQNNRFVFYVNVEQFISKFE
jgi:hypothetical protein